MKGSQRAFLPLLLALLALTSQSMGCGEDVTEVVVIADSDLSVPDEIDTVRFEVDATSVGGQTTTRRVALNEGGQVLPVRLAIVHEEGPLGPVDVSAMGMRGGADVVRRTARFHFIEGKSLVLHLDLLSRCVDESCPEGMTCGEEGCRDVDIDPGELEEDAGPGPGADAGPGPADSGPGDSGPPDSGPPDAGPMCPATCMCSAVCTTSDVTCECTDGCACDYDCPPGADCEKIECDHEGTVCTVDAEEAEDVLDFRCDHGARCDVNARGVSNVEAKCDHGSRCEIDCTGASNCTVDCKNGAECIVHCGSTSNCELKSCDEDDTERCGDLLTCNSDVCD